MRPSSQSVCTKAGRIVFTHRHCVSLALSLRMEGHGWMRLEGRYEQRGLERKGFVNDRLISLFSGCSLTYCCQLFCALNLLFGFCLLSCRDCLGLCLEKAVHTPLCLEDLHFQVLYIFLPPKLLVSKGFAGVGEQMIDMSGVLHWSRCSYS